jgi:hypothetical protein
LDLVPTPAPQFVVDQRQQAVERALVAARPGGEPGFDLGRMLGPALMMPASVKLRDIAGQKAPPALPLAWR